MTLIKTINLLFDKYSDMAKDNVGNEEVYRENIGRMRMCNELMRILSNDTLLMDVTFKTESLLRGE